MSALLYLIDRKITRIRSKESAIRPKLDYDWQINNETFAGKQVYAHGIDLDAHTLDFIESGLQGPNPDHRTARVQVIQNLVDKFVFDGKELPIKINTNSKKPKRMPVIIDPETGETVIEWLLRYLITNRCPYLATRNPDTFGAFLDEEDNGTDTLSIQPDQLTPNPTQGNGPEGMS